MKKLFRRNQNIFLNSKTNQTNQNSPISERKQKISDSKNEGIKNTIIRTNAKWNWKIAETKLKSIFISHIYT